MTLLELVIASAMMALLLSAVTLVLRTGRLAWEAHEADYTKTEALHATLRHIVRQVRQAEGVTAISAAADASGALSLDMPDGATIVWDHDSATQTVNCGASTADQLLANDIQTLNFVGYKADGITATTVPDEIQSIRITASVQMPHEQYATRSYSTWVWIRSW